MATRDDVLASVAAALKAGGTTDAAEAERFTDMFLAALGALPKAEDTVTLVAQRRLPADKPEVIARIRELQREEWELMSSLSEAATKK